MLGFRGQQLPAYETLVAVDFCKESFATQTKPNSRNDLVSLIEGSKVIGTNFVKKSHYIDSETINT